MIEKKFDEITVGEMKENERLEEFREFLNDHMDNYRRDNI